MRRFKIFLKRVGWAFLFLIVAVILLLVYFNIPVKKENENAKFGVTFSSRYASDIGLNWKEAYIAMLDDLKVRKIRVPVYWDLVEKIEGEYDFSDLDWQIQEAKRREAEIILVVGQKVPRWPECAIPEWAGVNDQKRKESLLKFIPIVIERYKKNSTIKYWQVENEPFLAFGICPKLDVDLLDKEIELVKKMDPSRRIIITDSGELSLWVRAAKRGDIFGTTMYRNVYKEGWGYYVYPVGPRFFHLKYVLINLFARQKNAIVIELQAEPWIAGWTTNAPLEEQFKSMNENKFKENIIYAKQVGFPEVYLWGVEWWYWLKAERSYPAVWDEAGKLFDDEK